MCTKCGLRAEAARVDETHPFRKGKPDSYSYGP
jgi:hypothetical protein